MKQCFRCRLFGDDESFYPNAPDLALCKACITARRATGVKDAREKSEKASREQAVFRDVVKQHQAGGKSLLYLLRSNTRFKIGFSRDVAQRLRAFDTALDTPCRLLAVAPGGRQQEQELHTRFAPYRVAREWFAAKPHILNHFKRLPNVLVFLPGYLSSELPAAERLSALSTTS